MARNNPLSLENRIMICREYAELWQQFFQYFTEEWEEMEISEQMEKQFEQLVTVLAINHFKFAELCGDQMKDAQSMIKLLAAVPSLKNMKAMAEATRGKLMVEAHTLLIDMHKALGRLMAKLTPKQLAAMQAGESVEQAG